MMRPLIMVGVYACVCVLGGEGALTFYFNFPASIIVFFFFKTQTIRTSE